MRTYEVVFLGEDRDIVARKFVTAASERAVTMSAMRGELFVKRKWKTVEVTQVGG